MAVDGWDGGPRMVDRWLRAAIRVVPHRGAPGPRLLARVGGCQRARHQIILWDDKKIRIALRHRLNNSFRFSFLCKS